MRTSVILLKKQKRAESYLFILQARNAVCRTSIKPEFLMPFARFPLTIQKATEIIYMLVLRCQNKESVDDDVFFRFYCVKR